MILPTALFRSDPRPVETSTAWIIISLSIWATLYGWFGGWFTNLAALHGWEPLATFIGVSYGIAQVWAAQHGSLIVRSRFCLFTASLIAMLGTLIVLNKGMEAPGAPVCTVGVGIFAWAYLRLVLSNATRGT